MGFDELHFDILLFQCFWSAMLLHYLYWQCSLTGVIQAFHLGNICPKELAVVDMNSN